MLNLSKAIKNRRINQTITVARSTGQFVIGGWEENSPINVTMKAVVSVVNAKELQQLPEGDRVIGAMVFHTVQELFVTHNDSSKGTSDKIQWRGDWFKILNVKKYADYGFYTAIGVRIEGD